MALVPPSTLSLGGGVRTHRSQASHLGHLLHLLTKKSNWTRPFLIQHLPGGTINLSIGQKIAVDAHVMLHTHYWQESSLLIQFLMCFLLNCWSLGAPANMCKDRHILGNVVSQPAAYKLDFSHGLQQDHFTHHYISLAGRVRRAPHTLCRVFVLPANELQQRHSMH